MRGGTTHPTGEEERGKGRRRRGGGRRLIGRRWI